MRKMRNILLMSFIIVLIMPIYYSNFDNNFSKIKQIVKEPKINYLDLNNIDSTFSDIIAPNQNWENNDTSSANIEFHKQDSINETTSNISISNCNDWNSNSSFYFSNIRAEKIINGDAEGEEELWTDFIPSNYEGNITKENTLPSGEVISGNYSWYFDITTDDHTTIAGFDDPISLESNSIIFSFSYSLLRNNLGSSYDSNICIRLFFNFDIYIFFWFQGNTAVLTNVTGPGGFADLLISPESFDSSVYDYSLNISALGQDLFNQEPGQLQSLAIQTWGEIPYEMEFLIDNLSLTDLISPNIIDLKVNSENVIGAVGSGSIIIEDNPKFTIYYKIEYNYLEKIMWDCFYNIKGYNSIQSTRNFEFLNWDEILWIENLEPSFNIPDGITNFNLKKCILKDWIVNEIFIDNLPTSFYITESNLTHNEISIQITMSNTIKFEFISNNLIDNILLSAYQITHNDLLGLSLDSSIYNQKINFFLMDDGSNIIYEFSNNTNAFGEAYYSNLNFDSFLPRKNYTILAFWKDETQIGIGKVNFEIISIPTDFELISENLEIIYNQDFIIEINYKNLEDNDTVDFATLSYSWDYGSGNFQQNVAHYYYAEITNNLIPPNIYEMLLICEKSGYASIHYILSFEIIFSDFSLVIITNDIAVPGDVISLNCLLEDNQSTPVNNQKIRFNINDQLYVESWTNISGIAHTLYYLSPEYAENTLNVSCNVIINDLKYLTKNHTINIDLLSTPKNPILGAPEQIGTNEDSVYFTFLINYTSLGQNWYVRLPNGFEPIDAMILSTPINISASISPLGYITWSKLITEYSNDILLVELEKPDNTLTINENDSSIVIEIKIVTNFVPYNGLEFIINRNTGWSNYVNWDLYINETKVTSEYNLEVTTENIKFNLYSTNLQEEITFQLKGSQIKLVELTPSTIIFGVGISILTVISTIILFKRKSKVSFDIQT